MRVTKITLTIFFLAMILQAGLNPLLFCEEETANLLEPQEENIRDPFVSLLPTKSEALTASTEMKSGEKVNLPSFSVQGLIWGTDRPQAIIDNKIFNLGDEIEGAKIVQITKEGVKILYQNNIFVLVPQTIKSGSKNQ